MPLPQYRAKCYIWSYIYYTFIPDYAGAFYYDEPVERNDKDEILNWPPAFYNLNNK